MTDLNRGRVRAVGIGFSDSVFSPHVPVVTLLGSTCGQNLLNYRQDTGFSARPAIQLFARKQRPSGFSARRLLPRRLGYRFCLLRDLAMNEKIIESAQHQRGGTDPEHHMMHFALRDIRADLDAQPAKH